MSDRTNYAPLSLLFCENLDEIKAKPFGLELRHVIPKLNPRARSGLTRVGHLSTGEKMY